MYFPSFYWIVRDFVLQIQDKNGEKMTEKDYLEKALAPQPGFSQDIDQKNRIRSLLTSFFKDRDCFTMIRPVTEQDKLQNLDKLDYEDLRPDFVQQVLKIRRRILSEVKVKSLQNEKLNGDMYCSVINSYVTAINEGAVPNIESAWKYMCEQQCEKLFDECRTSFMNKMKLLSGSPKSEDEFYKFTEEAEDTALEAFRQKAIGDNSNKFLQELKKIIKEEIKSRKI